MSPSRPFTARFMRHRRTVSATFSWPKMLRVRPGWRRRVGAAACSAHEAGALHEHAARPARRVEDPPPERLDDLDDQLDDGGGGEELAALLPLAHGELAQEVLVDLAERVPSMSIGTELKFFSRANSVRLSSRL